MRKIILDFYFTVLLPLSVVALVSIVNSIRYYRESSWQRSKVFILLSAGALLAFIAFMFIRDSIKLQIILGFWYFLGLSSILWLIYACGMAWKYADECRWLNFFLCVMSIVLALASAEHFLHQDANTRHAICPACGDSDNDSGN